jgi:hypothetical protein
MQEALKLARALKLAADAAGDRSADLASLDLFVASHGWLENWKNRHHVVLTPFLITFRFVSSNSSSPCFIFLTSVDVFIFFG